jgi:molybdopterin molybdotransferase
MREGLTVAEAQEWILERAPRLDPEMIPTGDALGRVLAEPVHSARLIPPADSSAMDGYAVRAADLKGATTRAPVELAIAFEVAAGGVADRELQALESARIFTGAPIPPGADAVIRQEDTESVGDHVRILIEPVERDHIRNAGEDLRPGDLVLEQGMRLGSAQIGVLASLGRSMVPVYRRPRVAILSGGDELVEVDGDVSGGRIVASNSYTLLAQCRAVGAEPTYLGISRDRPDQVERQFRAALASDCIVSSAGVSVGDHDHVRPVLEKLGCTLEFWGVKMKPGFPLAFGRFGSPSDAGGLPGPLVFGLPGNPVSASVTFEQFVRPALLKMAGHSRCHRPVIRATLTERLTKKAGRIHFVRATLERRDGEVLATSTGSQSSGVMRSLSLAQGLVIFPLEATVLEQGEEVRVQILDDHFFSGTESGI